MGMLRNFPIGNYLSIFSLDDDLVSKEFGYIYYIKFSFTSFLSIDFIYR